MKKKSIMGLEFKWEVLLVYLVGILGFIFSFMKDKEVDKDVRYQYNQSATIFIITVVISILSRILLRTIFGVVMFGIVFGLLELVIFVFAVITVVKAFNDESYEIPVISDITKSIWK